MTSNSNEKKWVRTKLFQHHTHNVQTVAHSPTALIFGSPDTHLVTHSLMEKKNGDKEMTLLSEISLFPINVSPIQKRQLLLFQFSHHLDLWRLGSTYATRRHGDILPLSKDADHLLHLKRSVPRTLFADVRTLFAAVYVEIGWPVLQLLGFLSIS